MVHINSTRSPTTNIRKCESIAKAFKNNLAHIHIICGHHHQSLYPTSMANKYTESCTMLALEGATKISQPSEFSLRLIC